MQASAGSSVTQAGLIIIENAVDNNGKHLLCSVFSFQLVCRHYKAMQLSKGIFQGQKAALCTQNRKVK